MLETLPSYITITFVATTVLTIGLLLRVLSNSKSTTTQQLVIKATAGIILWLAVQGLLSYQGMYSDSLDSLPPKIFLFGILPLVIGIIACFRTGSGRHFLDSLRMQDLVILSVVRVPVELVLLWLFVHGTLPQILTFEGWNFDIIMGLTAPLIYYFGFIKETLSKTVLLVWNVIGILLLLLVFVLAVLSSPFPLQVFGFDQPNVGLLHFPFAWLPTFIVPMVIWSHLVSIRQLQRIDQHYKQSRISP